MNDSSAGFTRTQLEELRGMVETNLDRHRHAIEQGEILLESINTQLATENGGGGEEGKPSRKRGRAPAVKSTAAAAKPKTKRRGRPPKKLTVSRNAEPSEDEVDAEMDELLEGR